MLDLIERSLALLREGKPARLVERKPEEEKLFHMSRPAHVGKPVLYVCNVEEAAAATGNAFSGKVEERAKAEGAAAVVISAKIESEIAILPAAERAEFLEAVGLKETGLDRVIRAGYALLQLVTYFTVGPKETRAWTITRAPRRRKRRASSTPTSNAASSGAETIGYDDFIGCNGESGARDAGKMRLEGKDYVVADGDVMHFRFAHPQDKTSREDLRHPEPVVLDVQKSPGQRNHGNGQHLAAGTHQPAIKEPAEDNLLPDRRDHANGQHQPDQPAGFFCALVGFDLE